MDGKGKYHGENRLNLVMHSKANCQVAKVRQNVKLIKFCEYSYEIYMS